MRSPMVLLTVAALVLGRLLGAGFDVTSVALAPDFVIQVGICLPDGVLSIVMVAFLQGSRLHGLRGLGNGTESCFLLWPIHQNRGVVRSSQRYPDISTHQDLSLRSFGCYLTCALRQVPRVNHQLGANFSRPSCVCACVCVCVWVWVWVFLYRCTRSLHMLLRT